MIIYKNTFDNTKTINSDFPIEDKFYALNNEGIVVDGITRDPIGVADLSKLTFSDMIEKYPRPSGAELAADEGLIRELKEELNINKISFTKIDTFKFPYNKYVCL